MTQSPLSRQLKELEDELGKQLLIRDFTPHRQAYQFTSQSISDSP